MHALTTGRPILRIEDVAFLTGAAPYTADLQHEALENSAHVVFVRSLFASAALGNIETADAASAPGVIAVVTGHDLQHLQPGSFTSGGAAEHAQPTLPVGEVRFFGEPVAAVIATTVAQAVDAAELVVVNYEPLEPVLTITDAIANGMTLAHADLPEAHDAARFSACEVSVTQQCFNPRQSPAPLEPRSMACTWIGDHLHIWAATQRPHGFRDSLVSTYDIDASLIHIDTPEVGGGFGGKVSRSPEEHALPALSQIAGRPVRWTETRGEWFAAATQGRGEQISVTLAGDRNGRFDAIRVELVKDAGAYPSVGTMLAASYGRATGTSVYDIAHAEFESSAVLTNLPPTSAFRGAGRGPIVAAIERTVDRYAHTVGLDPAVVRERNLVQPEQMPYTTALDVVLDEANYPQALAHVLAAADYEQLRAEQATRRKARSARQLGIGIGCYNHMTLGAGGEEAAVTIQTNGTVVVATGTTSQGHSHATTWAQLASDVLHIPLELISVVEGSTELTETGQGAVGSRSAQTAGVSIHRLSHDLVDRARKMAAEHLEAADADLVLAEDGPPGFHVVGTPSVRVTWAELAAQGVGTERELSCGEYYDAQGRVSFPSGSHLAVVEVDIDTGEVQLQRFVAGDDAGPRINPMVVEGQLHGGIASGIAQVLGETMRYDESGTPTTANFADYSLLSIDQVPQFELVDEGTRSSMNVLGVKGVGESGPIGATAAMHNAIVDALQPFGVDHLDLPCTPDRIWQAVTTSATPNPV